MEKNDHAFNICQQLRDQLMTSSKSTTDSSAIWEMEKSWTQANEKRCHLQVETVNDCILLPLILFSLHVAHLFVYASQLFT